MRAPVLLAAVLCAFVLAACGGDDGDDTAATPTPTTATTTEAPPPATTEVETTPAPAPEEDAPAEDTGGSGGDDEDAIREVVADYADAMAAKDGEKVCLLMTDDAQAELVKAFAELTGAKECAAAMGSVIGALDPKSRGKFETAKVTSVKVDGDEASAKITGIDGTTPLVKDGGEWRIALQAS